jgi:asparagine synthase (glutamine-hydrolysing)
MCGICGVAQLDGLLDPRVAAAVPAMTDALKHRGPDGEGVHGDGRAALGHRRLSIIDRAGGAQPLANEDGSRWIVFNGEVYNHKALRQELEGHGHRFRTSSDTEAILHGYEQWGPGVVDRLEGMFAFAILDSPARELFLARDRLGKKPLFYAVLGGALHFASEITALRRSPAWDGTLDTDTLEEYLALGYILAPRTIYRHVRKLEPGHWMRLSAGKLETRRYWDVPSFDGPVDASMQEALSDLLDGAVRERLESEVPLGAFLSGGIDSGLVVSYMAGALGSDVTTTSIGFGSAEHNELDRAAVTAQAFHTRHHQSLIDPRLDDVLDRIAGAFDEPFADSSAVPTYYVAGMAREHVTVALTGDGGDETFGGYGFRYFPHAMEDAARTRLPGAAVRALGWLGDTWPRSRRLPRIFRLGTILQNIARDAAAAYYFDLCFMKPNAARALVGRDPVRDLSATRVYDAVTEPYRRCPSGSAMQRAMYADLKVYLPNNVLVKVDRMSMAHGLEVRCPLLDRRVIEFGFRIPATVKTHGGRTKQPLRALAARRLPPELSRLPKRGFTAPVSEWLSGPHGQRFQDDVLHNGSVTAGLLDLERVRDLFTRHRTGQHDHGYALWAVWMLERWGRTGLSSAATS